MTECIICFEECDEPKLNCLCKGDGNGIIHMECLKKMKQTKCPQCRHYLRNEFDRRVHELFAVVLLFLYQNKQSSNSYHNEIDKLLQNSIINEKIWTFLEMITINTNVCGFEYSEELSGFKITCRFIFCVTENRFSRTIDRETNNCALFYHKEDCRVASLRIGILHPTKSSRVIGFMKKMKQKILNAAYL